MIRPVFCWDSRRNWEVKLGPNDAEVTRSADSESPTCPTIDPTLSLVLVPRFSTSVATVKQYTNYRWYMDSDLDRLQIYFGSLAREEQGLTRIFMSQK